jgi:adenylate cyclase
MNLASRLEGANKVYGTRVLISDETRARAGSDFVTRELDLIRVVGRRAPVRVFELVGRSDAVDVRRRGALALSRRRSKTPRDWDGAARLLGSSRHRAGRRCARACCRARRRIQARSPPADWDCVSLEQVSARRRRRRCQRVARTIAKPSISAA